MKAQRIIPVILILLTGCVTVGPKLTPEMSPVKYSKPVSSNAMISGDVFPYVLWYDDSNWNLVERDSPLYKELKTEFQRAGIGLTDALLHRNREVACIIIETRLKTTYNYLINDIRKWANRPGRKILKCEYVNVNGNDILFLKIFGKNSNSLEEINLNYILLNERGSVRIVALTQPHLFDEHQGDIFDLLNGLDFEPEVADSIGFDINNIEYKLKNIKKYMKRA